MKPVMVVAADTLSGDRIREMLAAARNIREMVGDQELSDVTLVLAGTSPRQRAEQMAAETGVDTTAMILPESGSWDRVKAGLVSLARNMDPCMILFAQTALAREVGPALALALDGISVANVLALDMDRGGFVCTRPVMDNTRVQDVRVPADLLIVISLAPGAGVAGRAAPGAPAGGPQAPGRVSEHRVPDATGPCIQRLSLSSRQGAGKGKLDQAPVVMAAGRGIGEKENLDRVRAFARAVPRAVMAASRPLVDQGWVGYDRQVGITGAVVTPELYIALGISGSSQHLAGMAGSKWVVSVNSSPEAPICRHSDLCIQADALTFMDRFLDAAAEDDSGEK